MLRNYSHYQKNSYTLKEKIQSSVIPNVFLKLINWSKGISSHERTAPEDWTLDSTLNVLTPYQSDNNDHQGPSGDWSTLTVPSLHKNFSADFWFPRNKRTRVIHSIKDDWCFLWQAGVLIANISFLAEAGFWLMPVWGWWVCIAPYSYPVRQVSSPPSQKAGHEPWLTSGTHSLVGGQRLRCKETICLRSTQGSKPRFLGCEPSVLTTALQSTQLEAKLCSCWVEFKPKTLQHLADSGLKHLKRCWRNTEMLQDKLWFVPNRNFKKGREVSFWICGLN